MSPEPFHRIRHSPEQLNSSTQTVKELIFTRTWLSLLFLLIGFYYSSILFHIMCPVRSKEVIKPEYHLKEAKVCTPASCSQQEPVWHTDWLSREVWDTDSFSMSRILECLEGICGTGGHVQASASHLAHILQPDHLGCDTRFKSPLEASRAELVSAQASRHS